MNQSKDRCLVETIIFSICSLAFIASSLESLMRNSYSKQIWPAVILLNVFTALTGTLFYIFIL